MNDEAKYRRIASELREEIISGRLAPGAAVPAGLALTRKYKVSRDTAGKVLRLLEHEGLITGGRQKTVAHHERVAVAITRHGTGWAGEAPTAGADSWGAGVLAAGRVPTQRINVLIQAADGEAGRRLGIALKPWEPLTALNMLTARQLVRYVDGEPHNTITFWFPHHIADGTPLMARESIAEGSIAWLEKRLKLEHPPWEALWRPPTREEAQILRIPMGVSVLELWRTSTAEGRPVVVSRAIYPGDRTKITG